MAGNYDFRSRLLTVHPADRRDPALQPDLTAELVLTDASRILVPDTAGPVLRQAACDLQDYLQASMGLTIQVVLMPNRDAAANGVTEVAGSPVLPGDIVVATVGYTGRDLGDCAVTRGFRLDCDQAVVISGFDERGAMQGCYYLEDCLNLRRAPFVRRGSERRRPLFSPRMVHSGYGLDQYPDPYLAAVAHAGMDAILVFVQAPDTTPAGSLDFNDLCRRAAVQGLDVYAYSYLKSGLHPDDPGAEAYYDRVYGSVFQSCPAFKGIVLVGESVEFPSRDERTTGRSYLTPPPDGLPSAKPSPGWWPCRDYPQWLARVKSAVRRYRPDADIVFWTYNWGYVEAPYRLELINSLPADISLLVTFEMFEKIKTGPVTSTCVDYTLMFAGPGEYFRSEAQAARECGIRLYAMVNTGGLTWDIGVIPFEPAPQQWMARHAAILHAQRQFGLCGLMESHHFGFWPSFVSDLAKAAFAASAVCPPADGASLSPVAAAAAQPPADPSAFLRRIAARDWGEANADQVVEAWALWSDGIRHCLPTNEDQYGPFRIGPAYPLILNRKATIPEAPDVLFGSRICHLDYRNADSGRCSPLSSRLPVEIASLTIMRDRFTAGARILQDLLPGLTAGQQPDAVRLVNLGHYISRCAQTTIHVKEWYQARLRLYGAVSNAELTAALDRLQAIAEAEIVNAEAAIPLVRLDSRLGWEPSMGYLGDEAHLRWKIRQVRLVLDCELTRYRASLLYND